MHTTFILDPGAIFARYSAWFTPTARLREGARVGFLVPARLCDLLFGAVPGFFVLRYVLALIAIVPLYVLLRSRYGRWAGWLGVALVLSSPVFVTAWGTDYPDGAVVSYLTAALAAFALALEPGRRRTRWVLLGACSLTLSVWSHGVTLPLVTALIAAYMGVRLRRGRDGLARDSAWIVGGGIVTTALLALCSKLLLGQFDFITPTVRSATYLAQPSQTRMFHSSSWAWAPYDTYLLIPPAVLLAFVASFAVRSKQLPASVLFVGITAALQLAVFSYLQFFGAVQTLETHFFSSMLWPSVTVLLALSLAAIFQPLAEPPVPSLRAIPLVVVLATAIVYELVASPVHMTWSSGGFALGALVVAVSLLARLSRSEPLGSGSPKNWHGLRAPLALGAAALVLGCILTMTTALAVSHKTPRGVAPVDPYPAYASALNGSIAPFLDSYAVDAQIPAFVGAPAYRGEVLLTWEPLGQVSDGSLQGAVGLYHNAYTWASWTFPYLGEADRARIAHLKPAQVLIMTVTGRRFRAAVSSLRGFQPVVVRSGVLSHGALHLHLWLVDLVKYMRRL